MRQHPATQLEKIAGAGVEGVALLEHADDVVLGEPAQIRAQRRHVRMRLEIIREIGDVIPDEQVGRDRRPAVHVVGEAFVGFTG